MCYFTQRHDWTGEGLVYERFGVMACKLPCHTGEGCIFLYDIVIARGDTHRWYSCFSATVDHPEERRYDFRLESNSNQNFSILTVLLSNPNQPPIASIL